jgi:multicomponent Na+:H+ antiporter subunit D
MKRTLTVTLDTDWLWRIFFSYLANTLLAITVAIKEIITCNAGLRLGKMQSWTQRHWGVGGVFARSWPIGTTAIWISVLLSAYVLLYYI